LIKSEGTVHKVFTNGSFDDGHPRLGGAFKLKKPVRFAYLDFSTLAERETDSRAELTLNRRLAPDVYLRVAPLVLTADAALKLGGQGQVVDWLVVMRRLPADRMLDKALADGTLEKAAVDRLAGALASFYHVAERPVVPPGEFYRRLDAEGGDNRDILKTGEPLLAGAAGFVLHPCSSMPASHACNPHGKAPLSGGGS
jgi:hypothetical protein